MAANLLQSTKAPWKMGFHTSHLHANKRLVGVGIKDDTKTLTSTGDENKGL